VLDKLELFWIEIGLVPVNKTELKSQIKRVRQVKLVYVRSINCE
jgi:hypothetical protein